MYKTDVSKLLNDSLETYYWIGYIYADGCLDKRFCLTMNCGIKDIDHITKYSKYVNREIRIEKAREGYFVAENRTCKSQAMCRISIGDKKVISLIKEKFGISNQKTYEPPAQSIFDKMTDDQFLAMFIGYTDGDGCVYRKSDRENCYGLKLSVHKSWLDTLVYFETRLYKILNINKKIITVVTNDDKAQLLLYDNNIISWLKRFILKNKLNVMERKWDKIPENYISSYVVANENRAKITKMIKDGKRKCDIARELNMSYGKVDWLAKTPINDSIVLV